jgi:hypothetical protein
MFAFSKDTKHLVIQDGFGLSRLTFPKSIKTDKSLAGQDLVASGNHLLVTAAKSNRRALRTIDALLNLPFAPSSYERYVLLPDGKHVIQIAHSSLGVYKTDGKQLATLAWPEAEMKFVASIDLGPSRPSKNLWLSSGAMSDDGTFAHFTCRGSATASLFVGHMKSPKKLEPKFRLETTIPAGQIIIAPGADECFLAVYQRGQRKATFVCVDARHEVHRWQIETISAPSIVNGVLYWQRDEATVCRTDWREYDKPERFTLPQECRGVGTVMGKGDRLLFLPADAERIVDVANNKVIDRKLPAKEKAIRERAIETTQRYDAWLGEESGAMRFAYLDLQKDGRRAYWSPIFDMGTGSLSSFLAFGDIVHSRDDSAREGLFMSSYSNPSGIAPVSLEDVRRAFAAIERYGALYARAFCGLEYAVKDHFEPDYSSRRERNLTPPPKLFAPEAATVVLRALFETFESATPVPLSANIDRWAKKPFTPKELANCSFPSDAWNGPAHVRGAFDAPMPAMFIALDLLGADALPAFIKWTVTKPAPHVEANSHIAVDAVARMIQYYSSTEQPYRAACEKTRGQGENMLRSLQFALGS